MAIEIIPKSEEQINHLECVYRHAIGLIDEVDKQSSLTYSIASAGHAFATEDQPTEQNIFAVIELLTSETKLTRSLRELLAELAQGAGVATACEVTNG